jgi:hypothetical protein
MIFEELLANFPDLKKDICYKILENPIYYLEDIKDAPTSFKSDTEYWNLCLENSSPTKIVIGYYLKITDSTLLNQKTSR